MELHDGRPVPRDWEWERDEQPHYGLWWHDRLYDEAAFIFPEGGDVAPGELVLMPRPTFEVDSLVYFTLNGHRREGYITATSNGNKPLTYTILDANTGDVVRGVSPFAIDHHPEQEAA